MPMFSVINKLIIGGIGNCNEHANESIVPLTPVIKGIPLIFQYILTYRLYLARACQNPGVEGLNPLEVVFLLLRGLVRRVREPLPG